MTIRYWNEDFTDISGCLLVREADVPTYSEFAECDMYATSPSHVIRISRNADKYKGLFLCLLARRLLKQDGFADIWAKGGELTLFPRFWELLLSAVTRNDEESFQAVKADILKKYPPLLDRTPLLIELIDGYFSAIYRYYHQLSPFFGLPFPQWTRQLNRILLPAREALEALILDVEKRFVDIERAIGILPKLRAQSTALLKLSSADMRVRLFTAAAFSMVLAKTELDKQRYQLALLLAHRAADLYFQYLCLSTGLARALATGNLEYIQPTHDKKRVCLENSKYYLVSRSKVILGTAQITLLEGLNFRRNELLLTHAFFAPDQPDSTSKVNDVHALLSNIEGTNEWSSLVQALKPYLSLTLDSIFDIHPELDTYYSQM